MDAHQFLREALDRVLPHRLQIVLKVNLISKVCAQNNEIAVGRNQKRIREHVVVISAFDFQRLVQPFVLAVVKDVSDTQLLGHVARRVVAIAFIEVPPVLTTEVFGDDDDGDFIVAKNRVDVDQLLLGVVADEFAFAGEIFSRSFLILPFGLNSLLDVGGINRFVESLRSATQPLQVYTVIKFA